MWAVAATAMWRPPYMFGGHEKRDARWAHAPRGARDESLREEFANGRERWVEAKAADDAAAARWAR